MNEASSEGALKRPNRVFYGWWIVVISLIVSALKHGTFNRGFTIYVLPIQNSLGIDRTAISLAETLGRLEGGLHGPLVGYLTDRFGGGLLMAAGGLISGLGFILIAFTHNYLYFMLVYVGLISLGVRAGYENASIPAVNQWFRRKRSLAMALVSAGQGLGCAAIPPLLGLHGVQPGPGMAHLSPGVRCSHTGDSGPPVFPGKTVSPRAWACCPTAPVLRPLPPPSPGSVRLERSRAEGTCPPPKAQPHCGRGADRPGIRGCGFHHQGSAENALILAPCPGCRSA